jgi:hypothetical protein
MRSRRTVYRSERGAVFLQGCVLILALMALNVFVVDYGVLWTARGQAQAAADAAALAGATARAYDMRIVMDDGVGAVAQELVNQNPIWKAAGGANVRLDSCPAGVPTCVTVDVHRDGTFGSVALPRFFAPLLGIGSHGIMATATAIVGPANTTRCLKPWAMPDEWLVNGSGEVFENSPQIFHQWGGGLDLYVRPDNTQATSATNFSTDYGDAIDFTFTYFADFLTADIRLQLMLPLQLAGGHETSMKNCTGQPYRIGERIPLDPGLLPPQAETVAQEVFDRDPSADWSLNGTNRNGFVKDSCAPGCAPISPRTWAVVLFDPLDFERNRATGWPDCPGGAPCVLVSNIAGFFIDYLVPGPLGPRHGHLVRYPGEVDPAHPFIVENGSWLVQPRLIR